MVVKDLRLWDKILSFHIGERVMVESGFHEGRRGIITYVNRCLNQDFFLVKFDRKKFSCNYFSVELRHLRK